MNIGEIGQYRNILLLQGPRGTFFRRFGRHLERRGCTVYKVNLNGGDEFFYNRPNIFSFIGEFDEWELYVLRIMKEKEIKAICLFGDCRPHHQVAIRIAQTLGIAVYVFEEGYVRPDYITFEKYGVNGNSQIPCTPGFYLRRPEPQDREPVPVNTSFLRTASSAVLYHFCELVRKPRFPHYKYHKEFAFMTEPLLWIRSGLRKAYYRMKERRMNAEVSGSLRKKYFFVPLQVRDDSQVIMHSKYRSVEDFIDEVIRSFARHADPDHFLIIKQHPYDRGHIDYKSFIESVAEKCNVAERIKYVHDVHLPSMLKNALGVVVINSTVGLSSLHHNTPVRAMGTAIYDIAGLTNQKRLDAFWHDPGKIDRNLYVRFREYIIQYTQVNGSFYGLSPFEPQPQRDIYQRSEQYAESRQAK